MDTSAAGRVAGVGVDDDPDRSLLPATTADRVAVGLAVVVAVAAVLLVLPLRAPVRAVGLGGVVGDVVDPSEYVDQVVALTMVAIGGLVVLRARARRYGWLLLGTGSWSAVLQPCEEYALLGTYAPPPGGLPLTTLAVWWQDTWMVPFVMFVLLLPALFPDGRAPGRWGRPVRWLTAAWAVLFTVWMLAARSASGVFEGLANAPANPAGVLPVPLAALNGAWGVLTIVSLVVAGGSVVSRWRSAHGEVRQQLKWVLAALLLAVVVLLTTTAGVFVEEVLGAPTGLLGRVDALLFATAWFVVVLAIGLGVLRYRLYDVDLVINRTLVYAVMTAAVLVGYAGLVVTVGRLAPGADEGASLLAAGAVAVAFAPVRSRVQRGVNRLMFGRRDDPFAVLSELGEAMARSAHPDVTLASVVVTVVEALRLPGAAVDLLLEDSFVRRAHHGDLGGDAEVVPLVHGGAQVGRLVLARRSPGESLHGADHRLLDPLATQTATLAHTLRLDLDLQRSREQLVTAREEERRRLRRDLHDGIGPSLAAQTFRLDAAIDLLAGREPDAERLLVGLKDHTRELVADVRRLVHALRPPALDELGLVGALAAHAGALSSGRGLAVDVDADPDPLGPLPAAVEVAAYRIASEAVTNVVRHADASRCAVRVTRSGDELVVEVADDGVGVAAVTRPGVGMSSMRERATELGGDTTLHRNAAGGTTVTARIPLPTAATDGSDPDRVPAPTQEPA